VNKSNVLIFPAGSEIGLEIFKSLKYSHHVNVFGASGKSDHASYIYNAAHYIEDPGLYVQAPGFIERLNELIERWQIEFIYPTHDTVAWWLSERQSEVRARVLTSCAETNRVARYKRETYRQFANSSFCPRIYEPPYDGVTTPVFLKPNDGQGGKGAYVARNRMELNFYMSRDPELIVSEYLPGEELGVDCFTDRFGSLRFVGPRTRERVQMGISFRTTAVECTEEVRDIARAINSSVKLDGAWFFQLKRDGAGNFKLLEFAPRQASTMGLYRQAGVNFALLSLFNARGLTVDIEVNPGELQLDRCLQNKFRTSVRYDRVYIDLDETLIADGRVNATAMAYLYQCRNDGISVVLITKHQYSVDETLHRLGISHRLFEQVIHLKAEQQKWDFINPLDAIFIDNYWHDRKAVRAHLGIPVFDVDAIEGLLR
jgi:hypothetical protein